MTSRAVGEGPGTPTERDPPARSAHAPLPPGLTRAFGLAVAELGYVSASWLYVDEVRAAGGDALVRALRDELGREWPVLDAVAAAALSGSPGPRTDPAAAVAACAGASRIVIVGVETAFLDPLVAALPDVPLALLRQSVFGPDWDRVIANFGGRVELESLDTFQRLVFSAGPSMAALLDVAQALATRHPPHAVYVGLAMSVCAGSSLFLTAATSGPLAQTLTERAGLRDAHGEPVGFGFFDFVPVGLLGFGVILAVGIGFALTA